MSEGMELLWDRECHVENQSISGDIPESCSEERALRVDVLRFD